MTAEVIVFRAKSNKKTTMYRKHKIEVEYDAESSTWSWHFVHTRTLTFDGADATFEIAIKRAMKMVDKLEGEL